MIILDGDDFDFFIDDIHNSLISDIDYDMNYICTGLIRIIIMILLIHLPVQVQVVIIILNYIIIDLSLTIIYDVYK